MTIKTKSETPMRLRRTKKDENQERGFSRKTEESTPLISGQRGRFSGEIYPKLSDLIDRATIKEIQESLGETFETGVAIIDTRGKLPVQPSRLNKFCSRIRSSKEGRKRCNEFWAKVKEIDKPKILTCHAGFCCLITPIIIDETLMSPRLTKENENQEREFSSEKLIGSIVVEGLLTSSTKISIPKLSDELKLDSSELTSILEKMDIVSNKDIEARKTHLFSIIHLISTLCYQKYQLDKRHIELSGLFEINKTIISTMDLRKVLLSIVNVVSATMGVKKCAIRLLDEKGEVLVMTSSCGLSKEYLKKTEIDVGKSIVGRVVKERKPMFVSNIEEDRRIEDPIRAKKEKIASLLSVPLIFQDRVLGTITVYSTMPHKYTSDEIALLSNLANQSSIVIENIRLFVLRREGMISITQSLTETIGAKDSYTKGHCERVANYSVMIASKLGVDKDQLNKIYLSGLFHDIGKIGISEKILLKPGVLTVEEFNEMKKHPTISVNILAPIDFDKEILHNVHQHHERIDGKGYPVGISSESITLGARIIEVADAYEAMISDRPYRKALSKSEAIMELNRCAGMQFDPQIVEVFIKILEEEEKEQKQ